MVAEVVASTRLPGRALLPYGAFTDKWFWSTSPTASANDALQEAQRSTSFPDWFTITHGLDSKTIVLVNDSLQVHEYAPTAMFYWQTAASDNDSLQKYHKEHMALLTAPRIWEALIAPPTTITTTEALIPQDALRASLMNRLWAKFEAEPLEDGVSHPAENVITEALAELRTPRALECFRDISLDTDTPGFAASVLRCLGRQAGLGTEEWRVGLVRAALGADDVEVRDAAAQAAESWGDFGMIAVLEAHAEPLAWLKDYIHAVVDDMRA